MRGLILGSTKLHRRVQLRPGGNEPRHRRFVLQPAVMPYSTITNSSCYEPAVMHLITVGSNNRYDHQLWNRQ